MTVFFFRNEGRVLRNDMTRIATDRRERSEEENGEVDRDIAALFLTDGRDRWAL